MRKREYETYMVSEEWICRKTAYFARHPKICHGCGDKVNIHLHHHTYERVGGTELDDDLVPLCETCHALVHRYYSIGGKNLSVCTLEVIAYLNGESTGYRSHRVGQRVQKAIAISAPSRSVPVP
jgi:hypothetical protein